MTRLDLTLGNEAASVIVNTAIIAGWTGRDRCAVETHIAELRVLGVKPPSKTPVFYRVSTARLTVDETIESTPAASGEVEPVLLRHDGRLWVGVGSDHTDRDVESYGVAVSKELCAKPLAAEWWAYDDVKGHWDELVMRSWITDDDDEQHLYQEGNLGNLLEPEEILRRAEPQLTDGTLMFCGTLPALGGIRPASRFLYELEDPVLRRAVRGQYTMNTLPLVS